TWWRSRSACCAASAWTAGLATARGSSPKSRLGKTNATPLAHASTGGSQRRRPATSWRAPIPTHPKSQNHCDEVLVPWREESAKYGDEIGIVAKHLQVIVVLVSLVLVRLP